MAHIIVRDGLVIGGWRRVPQKHILGLVLEPMVRLRNAEKQAIELAADQYSDFIGMPIEVTFNPKTVKVANRRAK